ncbi:phosphohistidine phosphatase [Enterobacter roggenkampii]|uniref:phosphohistidine phosphatase n=1 Tax=Enterobacter roggenkampii TaxID=1812935 RepID=UPI001F35D3AA|nr:phosphohistidine phosphatase [Enterobacter roggenkampii]MCE5964397.1 phosphohistidine phosphatase [Enterobacter roggenkampii]MCE5968830.1 phosphohistidine phosphatase [Enterobacter roggenkampii]UHY24792.1 phosphohistidine phosphatase [Enterobacter roggenkampii]
MDGLWEKISSYNIFNNLFPGALFVYFLERFTNVIISSDELIKNIVLYYFAGLLIGRIGSIVFEPILKLIRVVRFAPYPEYLHACQCDSKIEVLQEVANMYRTLFSMFLLLLCILYFSDLFTDKGYIFAKGISYVFALIFLVAYVKQIHFIIKRVNKCNNKLP